MPQATLIIDNPEVDANLYYITGFLAPDPIIYFEIKGRKTLVLSDLEIDRAKSEARVHSVLSTSKIFREIKERGTTSKLPPYAQLVDYLFRPKKIRSILIPASFPSLYYEALTRLGYRLTIKPDPFFPQRLVKSDQEKTAVKRAIAKVGLALKEALLILEKSRIKKNRIYFGKELVTSELLRAAINGKLMDLNCLGEGTIVAAGRQASFPHHRGSGPIIPHTPIIMDIFPRDMTTRYFADMTRTVVKGKPSDTVKKMYRAVNEANNRATETVRAGIDAAKVHEMAQKTIEKFGFKTGLIDGRMQGFIHSTGHGLGLDIHELPSVSTRNSILKAGHIVTVEPGLYYEAHGGVRLEDVVFVTKSGSEALTRIPKIFEIDG